MIVALFATMQVMAQTSSATLTHDGKLSSFTGENALSEALEEAAWDVYLAEAPKKEGQNDLTYIPVNEKTLARKNGDLMILYRLLPEIAVEAWKRIHGEKEEETK